MSPHSQQGLTPQINNHSAKVYVAVSGGVDSATAAATLLQAGFDCTAVYMKLYDQPLHRSCDAEKVAKHLGIPFEVLDLSEDFKKVIGYFCGEYKRARTPNPCVFCNRHIKFGKLFEYAKSKGADFIATGHYVQTIKERDGSYLYAANNLAKDQSYALAMIARSVLKSVIFPLGMLEKSQTRKLAAGFGLEVSDKADSQEICFIPDNDYAAKLEELCPELIRQGNIIDDNGKILGTHTGIHHFTIGQRRGLKVAMGVPYYVTNIDAAANTVTLGPVEELVHKSLIAEGANWLIDMPAEPFAALIKIRYNHKAVPGTVLPEKDSVKVVFDTPIRAITPGQAVVFYLKNENGLKVAGGAWIKEALD
ncbi:MAG: tRNA 2-thiouridine(34) synthase MnmA [Phycisphaerae bacterium]|nr:tRNA 2-thiouridine(34) synthase MnmA [Phycisphaerae bacterium]